MAEGSFDVADGAPDLPSFAAKLTRIRFHESDGQTVALSDRAYGTRFEAGAVRYLNVELDFVFPPAQADAVVSATCLFVRQNGTVCASIEVPVRAVAGPERAVATRGFGRDAPGGWPAGRYRAVCVAEGRVLGDAVVVFT